MKKISTTITLMSALLMAQNTVEDVEAPSVVGNLAPSVIKMPEIKEEKMISLSKTSLDHNESMFEVVNGVIRKKLKKITAPTHIKLDEEAKEVENLEPTSINSLK